MKSEITYTLHPNDN